MKKLEDRVTELESLVKSLIKKNQETQKIAEEANAHAHGLMAALKALKAKKAHSKHPSYRVGQEGCQQVTGMVTHVDHTYVTIVLDEPDDYDGKTMGCFIKKDFWSDPGISYEGLEVGMQDTFILSSSVEVAEAIYMKCAISEAQDSKGRLSGRYNLKWGGEYGYIYYPGVLNQHIIQNQIDKTEDNQGKYTGSYRVNKTLLLKVHPYYVKNAGVPVWKKKANQGGL